MKRFRIIPDINNTQATWSLEQKLWNRWERVFRSSDIMVVKKMKDHLLKRPLYYDSKSNVPEEPLRTRPSVWPVIPKLKRLRIKRKDLPESLR